MTIPKSVPLYPKYSEFKHFNLQDFLCIQNVLDQPWKTRDWEQGFEFLAYIGRNKSTNTFTRFRGEIEKKILLWIFLIKEQPLESLRKADILEYIDFFWTPPKSWMCFGNFDRFEQRNGCYHANSQWKPYKVTVPKSSDLEPDKSKYRPSQQSLAALFTAINAFFKHLNEEEYLFGNPRKKTVVTLLKTLRLKTLNACQNHNGDTLLIPVLQWQTLMESTNGTCF